MTRLFVLCLTAPLVALTIAACTSGSPADPETQTPTTAASPNQPSPALEPSSTPSPSPTATPTPEPTATPTATLPPADDRPTPAPTQASTQPPAPTATPTAPAADFPLSAAIKASTAANAWSPPAVDIAAGGTVTWSWSGTLPHNVEVASTNSGIPAQSGGFAYTFSAPGNYTFNCPVHPGMAGTVRVH